ncbi:hypothetical protein [Novosphingobium soli]|uniref:Uncharacterized protein n=1 Tax=Novosphingobium soli TaxID=574956 RepID=A0ABV6CXK0_9SPHN
MQADLVHQTVRPRILPSPRPRGPWVRLLSQVLALAGPLADFLRHAERPWASATFAGARHALALHFSGEAAMAAGEEFIAALPDHEFALAGHVVADATVAAIEHRLSPPSLTVEVELLLLEDCGR